MRYRETPGTALFPLIFLQKYNIALKKIFMVAGPTRPAVIFNPTTIEEEIRPLHKIASSHLARICFIGNLYKQVKDPNQVGVLSGHKDGSKAFARYHEIDKDIKREALSFLE